MRPLRQVRPAPPHPFGPVSRQLRVSDEVADWLALQGGSLSSAAERTLLWAMEAIDGTEESDEPDEPLHENGQYGQAPRAGDRPRAVARTSAGAAQRARWFGTAARPRY